MPNDDYIKRSDALSIIVRENKLIFKPFLMNAFTKIPAADVEPVKHGRWIDEHPGSPLDPRMRCSVCEHVDVPMWSWCFCPMCGAKMGAELPKEEDDG